MFQVIAAKIQCMKVWASFRVQSVLAESTSSTHICWIVVQGLTFNNTDNEFSTPEYANHSPSKAHSGPRRTEILTCKKYRWTTCHSQCTIQGLAANLGTQWGLARPRGEDTTRRAVWMCARRAPFSFAFFSLRAEGAHWKTSLAND